MPTDIETRPSVRIFDRTDPRWKDLADEDSVYQFGYGCGQADIEADLPPMTNEECSNIWHPDYTEGYLDAYHDHDKTWS